MDMDRGMEKQTHFSKWKAWAYEGLSGSYDPSTSTPWVIRVCLHLDTEVILLQVSLFCVFAFGITTMAEAEETQI